MRVFATLLFFLSAATGAGAVAIGLRTFGTRGADGPSYVGLLELLHFAVPLVLASGIFLALAIAARFAGERQHAELRGEARVRPDRERTGLWLLRFAVVVTFAGMAAVAYRLGGMMLAGEGGGPLEMLELFSASMRPLLGGALLAAAGTAMRRPARA